MEVTTPGHPESVTLVSYMLVPFSKPLLTPMSSSWLVSPYFFVMAVLLEGDRGDTMVPSKELVGTWLSSLHKLKDINNKGE
jgi:hypothetical protein